MSISRLTAFRVRLLPWSLLSRVFERLFKRGDRGSNDRAALSALYQPEHHSERCATLRELQPATGQDTCPMSFDAGAHQSDRIRPKRASHRSLGAHRKAGIALVENIDLPRPRGL